MSLTRVPTPEVEGKNETRTFKLVLAYTIAVYPAHWTVGAAELTITVSPPSSSSSSSPSRGLGLGLPDVRVIASRTASAIPTGWAETPVGLATSVLQADDQWQGSEDDVASSSRLPSGGGMYSRPGAVNFQSSFSQRFHQRSAYDGAVDGAVEQWNRKMGNVVGTQTDGKWVVIAGSDNVLQVSSSLSYRLGGGYMTDVGID